MSDLAQLTAAGRSDVIPGYTLSPFGLRDYGQAEEDFARAYLATAAAACVGLPAPLQKTVMEAALRDVRAGELRYGTDGFDAAALAPAATPYLLWLSLRKVHPTVTPPEAAALLTPANEKAVHRAVLEMAGFKFGSGEKKAAGADTGGPSGGAASSPPSAPVDSGTTPSPA